MKTIRIAALLVTTLMTFSAGAAARADTPLTTVRVASGLNRPVFVTSAPDDTERLFVVEKRGVIRILDLNTGGVQATPFLDIDSLVSPLFGNNDERGLLGLAFHPDYNSNGFFYVNYINNSSDTVIARYTRLTPDEADAGSAVILMTIDQPQTNHNGGWMDFGPDGFLYIATGDGGGGGDDDPGHTLGVGNAQDISDNLLGKMLRIDVDGGSPFAIPPDNPFVGVSGDDEIWAFGLRNPWRNDFDNITGDLYIADVGQGSWEEVDFQAAGSTGGENYGWRCREGAHNFNTTGDCSQTPFTDPIHEYIRGGSPFRCAITGGEVYRGCAIPDLRGSYFFADFCSDQIWSLRYDDVTQSVTELIERTGELAPGGGLSIVDIVSFGADANGELYIVEQGSTTTGEVFQIVPAGSVDPPTPHDYDNDGRVDGFDTRFFVECQTAPATSFDNCLCDVFDEDANGVIDLIDYAGFQRFFDN